MSHQDLDESLPRLIVNSWPEDDDEVARLLPHLGPVATGLLRAERPFSGGAQADTSLSAAERSGVTDRLVSRLPDFAAWSVWLLGDDEPLDHLVLADFAAWLRERVEADDHRLVSAALALLEELVLEAQGDGTLRLQLRTAVFDGTWMPPRLVGAMGPHSSALYREGREARGER